jgi:hypothetical protein
MATGENSSCGESTGKAWDKECVLACVDFCGVEREYSGGELFPNRPRMILGPGQYT